MATGCLTETPPAQTALPPTAASAALTAALLGWYGRCSRDLPWRQTDDPYAIWVSEIMLQQTQVATVIPYYRSFLARWPSVDALATANRVEVLKQWEGLGYYSRAVHLHEAAQLVTRAHSGHLPATEQALRRLPGIGEYTACAILSIAFKIPAAAVDGNVVRVLARLMAAYWQSGRIRDRRQARQVAESLISRERPGDWNQALMDLGATLCLSGKPRCADCPLQPFCAAGMQGNPEAYPLPPAKKSRPVEEKHVVALVCAGLSYVHRRPEIGLLAGLYEFCWLEDFPGKDAAPGGWLAAIAAAGAARTVPLGSLRHDFTHLRWELDGCLLDFTEGSEAAAAAAEAAAKASGRSGSWVTAGELAALPFPVALETFRRAVLIHLGAALTGQGLE